MVGAGEDQQWECAMTAHKQKPTITPGRIAWFAAYHLEHPEWGVFHVPLSDNNWGCPAAPYHPDPDVRAAERAKWPADVREAAEWFDQLTPSQHRRLERRVEKFNAREVALFTEDGTRLTEWARWDRISKVQARVIVTGTARWVVMRNGFGREVDRREVDKP